MPEESLGKRVETYQQVGHPPRVFYARRTKKLGGTKPARKKSSSAKAKEEC